MSRTTDEIQLEGCEREQLINDLIDQETEEIDMKFLVAFYQDSLRDNYNGYTDAELTEEYISRNGTLPFDGDGK